MFIFGGVAQIGRQPADAGTEFRVAIAGPLSSFGLAGVFAGLWWLDRAIPYLATPSTWLMRSFFVTENDHLRGLLTLTDVTKVPKENWEETAVGQVTVPWERVVCVEPDKPLLSALQAMDDANVNQVPVVIGDQLVGMLSRERVLHYIRTRTELGM